MALSVLVFGNPLVKEDSIALRLLPALRKRFPLVRFKEFDAAENLEKEGRNLVILDSAVGISDVAVLDGLGSLSCGKACSMHDFDLALTLKLLKKMGRIDSVCIIAVPSNLARKDALTKVVAALRSLLRKG
ncbi:hypothetical protein L0Y65_05495 [Candidatus Micrarchaeota archaeon]|nr:hypothetical protein [Candidatus Micrarchaeota archaeon]